MNKKQLTFMDNINTNGRKEPLTIIKANNLENSTITFDEILLGQTSIVAPEGAVLERRVNPDTSQEYLVKRFNHVVGTHNGDLRSVEIEIETLPSQGLTDYFDDKVLLTLHSLALEKDSYEYYTNISEICAARDWPLNGEYIAKVRKSLEKLEGTSIASDQFVDPDTNESIKQRINLLSRYVRFKDEQRSTSIKKDGILYDDEIKFKKDFLIEINQFFFKSLQKQKIKLDIKVLNSFRNKTVEKLYRFLNTMFQLKSEIEINLTDLCETLGITVPKYISNIKRNIYVRYIKEIEKNNIIKPFDIKTNYYKHNKIWRVKFERGEFYESLEDRWAMKPALFNIFNYLHAELKFKKHEAHTLMGKYANELIQENINYLRLSLEITPNVIRYPKAWMKKSLENNWDHSLNLQILRELKHSKTPLTQYQQSWEKRDFNEEEKQAFERCTIKFKIPENIVIPWIKTHANFDYIKQLDKVFDLLKPEEQKYDYLATMIRHRDSRVWRITIPGSEQEQVANRIQKQKYQSLFANEIVIEPDDIETSDNITPVAPPMPNILNLMDALKQHLGEEYNKLFNETYMAAEPVLVLGGIDSPEAIRDAILIQMQKTYLPNFITQND